MLGKALKMMRVFHDLTQKELSEKLGVSKSHLSEIESGKTSPSLDLLKRYSEAFDVPTSSIMLFSEHIDGEIDPEAKMRTYISSKILALMSFIAQRSGRM